MIEGLAYCWTLAAKQAKPAVYRQGSNPHWTSLLRKHSNNNSWHKNLRIRYTNVHDDAIWHMDSGIFEAVRVVIGSEYMQSASWSKLTWPKLQWWGNFYVHCHIALAPWAAKTSHYILSVLNQTSFNLLDPFLSNPISYYEADKIMNLHYQIFPKRSLNTTSDLPIGLMIWAWQHWGQNVNCMWWQSMIVYFSM